jgi:hypothetical protein
MRRKYSVLSSLQQYNYLLPIKKVFLLAAFLLSAFFLSAQEEVPEIDSALTIPNEVPADESRQYFLPKWMDDAGLDSFRLRRLPDTAIASLKRDAAFWYADSVFRNLQREKLEREKQSATRPQQPQKNDQYRIEEERPRKYNKLSDQSWFQGMLWFIVIGGFLAFVIMYLVNRNVQLFRRPGKNIPTGEEEVETEDIFSINYQKEIDKAAANKNYRLAIRLMFLRSLR